MRSKGLVYFTDGQLPENIADAVRWQLYDCRYTGPPTEERYHQIVAVSLKEISWDWLAGDDDIILPLQRGILTMFKQILAGLEALTTDVAFLCEHDCLYHTSHFDFDPPRNDVYYYNTNVWKLWMEEGVATRMDDCKQVSGLCGDRELLLGHYQRRVAKILQNQIDLARMGKVVENDGFSKHMGYEPGGHMVPRGVDEYPMLTWSSEWPIIDLRHGGNWTRGRRRPSEFHDPQTVEGWLESNEIPGWGKVSDIMGELA